MMQDCELKEYLTNGARQCGICKGGYDRMLHADSIGSLIDYYIENPEWCLSRGWPDLVTLKSEFRNLEAEEKGVFIDKTFVGELLNDRQIYIFHNCKGRLRLAVNYEKKLVPIIYIANGCKLRIQFEHNPTSPSRIRIPIYSFGKNNISARDTRWVLFVRHSSNEFI